MNIVRKTFPYGDHQVTIETGRLARQATGSILITMGETVVLVTVVGKNEAKENADFFPLTVNYQEKSYAVGKVPGGYFKREGRPTERETLVSRLIDRPLRPLFPDRFTCEVQIIATVLSLDPAVSTDIPAIIGAAAALAISGIPFNGPLAAARVGFQDGHYILNPSRQQLENSRLDLVVAGTRNAVLMVESEADQLSEDQMLGAVLFGHEQLQVAIRAIEELAEEVGISKWDWQPPAENLELKEQVHSLAANDFNHAYQIHDKQERYQRLNEVRKKLTEQLCNPEDKTKPSASLVSQFCHQLEASIVRNRILLGESRIDGRDTITIRPITIEVGVLPRTHGSAIFTRGETQALVVTTLGTERDAQTIDALDGDRKEAFMLHYNFPPFCVGETGALSGPKRREIGHGNLAKRAMQAVIPNTEQFPYVLRVVSEITESNGSSSMASVCGSSLALMDAGVPIKSAVAGIAMGLIKEEDKYAILSDIIGDEDHLGDMDFKVAGTSQGVTALQMDIKISGITKEIMHNALEQARVGRVHILNLMQQAIQQPRADVSHFAPRIITLKINPEKIRDVIGKGGETIRKITEGGNCTIDISDDGVVKIAAVNLEDAMTARKKIENIVADLEIGQLYEGTVVKVMDFGAFVSVLSGKQQGLVHISEISPQRIQNIYEVIKEGQLVRVKVIEIDRQGRVRMSMKAVKDEVRPDEISS